MTNNNTMEGILPVNKPRGNTAFSLIRFLRKHLGIKKIGHAGTLDPFATGVMILLIGRKYTQISDHFLNEEKEYLGRIHLGVATDTFDCEGTITQRSDKVPKKEEIAATVKQFQGKIQQIPPMYSAKKRKGKKLYQLAREGKTVEREPIVVQVETEVLNYTYPYVDIRVKSSKGTYIRAIAHDIGTVLGCGGHLSTLTRIRSGRFHLVDCLNGERLEAADFCIHEISEKLYANK